MRYGENECTTYGNGCLGDSKTSRRIASRACRRRVEDSGSTHSATGVLTSARVGCSKFRGSWHARTTGEVYSLSLRIDIRVSPAFMYLISYIYSICITSVCAAPLYEW